MYDKTLLLAGIGMLLASTAPTRAQVFHAIDPACGAIVRIDAATGDVQVIGPHGQEFVTGLTSHGDTLYGIVYEIGVFTDLLTIDPTTGAVTESVPVTLGGAEVAYAESLAVVDGQLMIGFNTTGACCQSSGLGELALDGTIGAFTDFGAAADFDSMAARPDSANWVVDVAPGSQIVLYRSTLDSYDLVGALTPIVTAYAGIAQVGEDLFIVEFSGDGALLRVDPDTLQVIETITFSRPGPYGGLAQTSLSVCVGDLDSSGDVGFGDLLTTLSAWGPCDCCPYDYDGDGQVAFTDLLVVLGGWGACE